MTVTGTDVIAGSITANADPVTVAQGERPPAPDPLETPHDYAIGDKVRLAVPPASPDLAATASPR